MNTTNSPATITTELIEHADGRPIAYTDASHTAVFTYQDPAGGPVVVDINTRDDHPTRILLDGQQLPPPSGGAT